jgi:hypothetical protein
MRESEVFCCCHREKRESQCPVQQPAAALPQIGLSNQISLVGGEREHGYYGMADLLLSTLSKDEILLTSSNHPLFEMEPTGTWLKRNEKSAH